MASCPGRNPTGGGTTAVRGEQHDGIAVFRNGGGEPREAPWEKPQSGGNALRSRVARVSAAFWERQTDASKRNSNWSIRQQINQAFTALSASLMSNPEKLAEATADYWRRSAELWSAGLRRMQGEEADLPPMPRDRRFRGEAWEANATFDYLRRSYVLASDWMRDLVDSADMDPEQRRRVSFYTRQFLSAASPANFVATNPEVLKRVAGDRRPEPCRRARTPSRRPGEGQGTAENLHDGRVGLRGRAECRRNARQGCLPERHDAADPVRPFHGRSSQSARSCSSRHGSTSST